MANHFVEKVMPSLTMTSLGSGSSGNAIFGSCGDTRFLIDCGIGPRVLARRLGDFGVTLDSISFVFVTHEHGDHIRSLPQLLKRHIEVVTGKGTAQAIGLSPRTWSRAKRWEPISIDSVELVPLPVSHDAAEPLGVMVRSGTVAIAVLTDIGTFDESLVRTLTDADVIVLEANHDVSMLRSGPYPHYLKRRVMSAAGHLSNRDCASMIRQICESGHREPRVRLAHLSVTNNSPDLARQTVLELDPSLDVGVLARNEATPLPSEMSVPSIVKDSRARQMHLELFR